MEFGHLFRRLDAIGSLLQRAPYLSYAPLQTGLEVLRGDVFERLRLGDEHLPSLAGPSDDLVDLADVFGQRHRTTAAGTDQHRHAGCYERESVLLRSHDE